MQIIILSGVGYAPNSGINKAYLRVDGWDDYCFKTTFHLSLHDEKGNYHDIGNIKIGFKGQEIGLHTRTYLDDEFSELPDDYFSLGQDSDYYQKLSELPRPFRESLLYRLNDAVLSAKRLEDNLNESVMGTSLLRHVSLSAIRGQFSRALAGQPPLSNFEFTFSRPATEKISEIELDFNVVVGSTPSTNIHAIIGRNGVGKTTLLNGMITAITSKGQSDEASFYDLEGIKGFGRRPISHDYFSSLVSVSFSAFDPFDPPKEQADPSLGTCYYYIGLKKPDNNLKGLSDIHDDFINALNICFNQQPKRERWLKAIDTLESDENFASMNLKALALRCLST
nr:hypothetical protein [Endozoicomonas acroporae]